MSWQERFEELRKSAAVCRRAQKRYFSTRRDSDLRVAKDAERRLDELIERADPDKTPPALLAGE